MLLRIQTSNGVKRIECQSSDSTESLIKNIFQLIEKEYELEDIFGLSVYKDRTHKIQIPLLERKTLSDYGLRHGDMIYVVLNESTPTNSTTTDLTNNINSNSVKEKKIANNCIMSCQTGLVEDEVDVGLYSQNGRIDRPPDPKVCRHGLHAKCIYCAPIEPYDESYLREQNVKHMSFHTYLKKVTNGIDKGKFALLENISCKIKPGCREHAPWPNGICTNCQPNAVTLNRQVYRHVDNVTFENASIVENFLNYWRTTGHQRIGFLYGYYSIHKDVPLGIKSNVVAIYEPPQESSRDFVKLILPDKKASEVESIAAHLGLKRIGWIFTDLIPDDIQKGTVKHLRNANSHFLSAQECVMAGFLQNIHPNACRLSPDGYFGSKFVTVCVTGDISNQVHMEAYQVSNQCMALVRDNCLLPTKDAPELGYVRESTSEQYVPDVFYKEKDGYGNEVTRIARPLPIEYLLIDVPVSTPMDPKYSFNPLTHLKAFPIENRFIEGHIQDFNALSTYLDQFSHQQFLEAMSDFHLLIYIATMDTLPLSKSMDPLLEAIKTRNTELADQWARSEQWATVEQLRLANNNNNNSIASTSSSRNITSNSASLGATAAAVVALPQPNATAVNWSCVYCTYDNNGSRTTCEICNLPKDA